MSGHTIEGMARQVGGEWEKLILLTTVVVLGILGVGAWGKLTALWQQQTQPGAAVNPVNDIFTDQAWAFLGDQPEPTLPGDHAFSLKRPPGWQAPKPPGPARQPRQDPPPRKNWRDTADDILKAQRQARQTAPPQPEPKTAAAPPKTPPPAAPPPKPAPKEPDTFVAFNGFIALENGEPAAYLVRSKGKQRSAGYIPVGGKIGTYEVRSVDADEVVLGSPSGEELRVSLSERKKANDL